MTLQHFVRLSVALLFVGAQFFPLIHIAVEHADPVETCGHENSSHLCTGPKDHESAPCQVCVTAQGINLAEELGRTVEVVRLSEQLSRVESSLTSRQAFVDHPRSRGPPAGL